MSREEGGVRFSPEAQAEFERLLGEFPLRRSALLPTLRLAQAEFGYLSPPVIRYVAELLGLSPMEVYSVTSFYEMLHTRPVGRYHLCVCRNLSCTLRGAEEILRHLERRLGIRVGQTTKDGRFSLAVTECLGSCGTAPMFWCNDAFYENLTPKRVDELLDAWAKAEPAGRRP